MKTKTSFTVTPSPPSPSFGLPTSAKGNLIIDIETAKGLDFEKQLAIVLFAEAGVRFIDGRESYFYMLNRVAHVIDKENGGLLPEFQRTHTSGEVIAAASAHYARANERKASTSCVPVFVGGLALDCLPTDLQELFVRWEIVHIYLAEPKVGLCSKWAKVYMSPTNAEAAIEYYSVHEAWIHGKPVNVAKAAAPRNTTSKQTV